MAFGLLRYCAMIEYKPPAPSRPRGGADANRSRLSDGRWHFQHGPIDLIVAADGDAAALTDALAHAWVRFQGVLAELAAELSLLRAPVEATTALRGAIALRMHAACLPHAAQFITPMAAVAGAVADEMIGFFRDRPGIARAYVNNGGDIALHLAPGAQFKVGLIADLARVKRREALTLDGDFTVTADLRVRGIATSGWRGRSFSLGIADSVTVLAATAADADAAATMVANSVNVDDPAILRTPACALKDDTDLGTRLVTVGVGVLSAGKVEQALAAGAAHAQRLVDAGTIHGAVLCLQGCVRVVGGATVVGRPLSARPAVPSEPAR
jgi:ApbE superfamily uncharacterized protein (UPF0280 family)